MTKTKLRLPVLFFTNYENCKIANFSSAISYKNIYDREDQSINDIKLI